MLPLEEVCFMIEFQQLWDYQALQGHLERKKKAWPDPVIPIQAPDMRKETIMVFPTPVDPMGENWKTQLTPQTDVLVIWL